MTNHKLVIGLHPPTPMSAADFTKYLTGLTITAYEVDFNNPTTLPAPPHLGIGTTAKYDPDPTKTTIYQAEFQDLGLGNWQSAAAAAAVIELTSTIDPKYLTPQSLINVVLHVQRAGARLVDHSINYDVEVEDPTFTPPDGSNPLEHFSLEGVKIGLYLVLPDPKLDLGGNTTFLVPPADGSPVDYTSLDKAVRTILHEDPGGALPDITNLAPADCLHIARELVSSRTARPLPLPIAGSLQVPDIGQLYTDTGPGTDTDRTKFEGALSAYYNQLGGEASRMAGFVAAWSMAQKCQQLSHGVDVAAMSLPARLNSSSDPGQRAYATLLLANVNPQLEVRAEYFYALSASLPVGVSASDRFTLATRPGEGRLALQLQAAIDNGVIPSNPGGLTPLQAARRLVAIGAGLAPTQQGDEQTYTDSQATQPDKDAHALIQQWLGAPDPANWQDLSDPDQTVWAALLKVPPSPAANTGAQLRLVACALTGWNGAQLTTFATALSGIGVNNADDLAILTADNWTQLFTAHPDLLPAFTEPPGTTVATGDRITAFLRYLQRFYAVKQGAGSAVSLVPGEIPLLDRYGFDPLAAFLTAYGTAPAYTFGTTPPDDAAATSAVETVFPSDTQAQQWLLQALRVIDELVKVTTGLTSGSNADALQFSIIEGLYARGFTDAASIARLDQADFIQALTGCVASSVSWAAKIWAAATKIWGGSPQPQDPAPTPGFTPVNPGALTDCVAPPELSPLGPVQYLHELLEAGPASTCATPAQPNSQANFGATLTARRGNLGTLAVTKQNLCTPLPVIDLVNECLEYLTAQVVAAAPVAGVGGTVYDTAANHKVGDHAVREPDTKPGATEPYQYDPAQVLTAVPEHSSPASPLANPDGYGALATDYSSPLLPYAQPLDVNREYLTALGTSRHAVMRRFREQITEFVLDPNADPAGFDPTVWRYPLRLEIALEYLQISSDEYLQLFKTPIATGNAANGQLSVWQLYGFAETTTNRRPWLQTVIRLGEFLTRTGLAYCDFVELANSSFTTIQVRPRSQSRAARDVIGGGRGAQPVPQCPPCHLDDCVLDFGKDTDAATVLMQLAVFIRLWRLLQQTQCARYSFADLADICAVLGLFEGGSINPDFIPELAALQILRDELCLPLRDSQIDIPPAATGAARTPLLALWDPAQPADPPSKQWSWAVDEMLEHISAYAIAHHDCRREPELIKVLAANLDELSTLAGFNPATPPDTWHHSPRRTLRFAEILSKIYASPFTVGEIEFLFTTLPHLDGDDPLALCSDEETRDDPLQLPDDDTHHSLWALRRALLEAEVNDDELDHWTWPRIDAWLRDGLGYNPATGSDPINSLAEHSFPNVLERQGHNTPPGQRLYQVELDSQNTSPGMWNTDPDSPISYDPAAKMLQARLPLSDHAVSHALTRLRQLNEYEAAALRDLYWKPRLDLAAAQFLFDDPMQADWHLIQERDEHTRWRFFRRHVLLTRERCRIIAAHLAAHAGGDPADETDYERAWLVLKSLYADENTAVNPTTWEGTQPSGAPPQVAWPTPAGGAFTALLGLRGTGLRAEYSTDGALLWSEQTGALNVFGQTRNEHNAPLPTLIPALQPAPGTPSPYVQLRNGFAFSDPDDHNLGGAQGFSARMTGVLLVDEAGRYRFAAGAPTDEGQPPSVEHAKHKQWKITLTRGQREWVLLAHHWPDQPNTAHETTLELRRGAYDVSIEYNRPQPEFDDPDDIHRRQTGLQLKYGGPDTLDELHTIPFKRLFIAEKAPSVSADTDLVGDTAAQVLKMRYSSSLRDIRRTYQRAFKALLFAHRFELSAHRGEDDQSELGYMLAHPDRFAGASYPRTNAGFSKHQAQFDFNLLPVFDTYRSPTTDDRATPSAARQAALFDWWERLFDYTALRRENHQWHHRSEGHHHRHRVWRLFTTAAAANPTDRLQLAPYLQVPLDHNDLVQRFNGFSGPLLAPNDNQITATNLIDERWTIRAWKAERLVHEIVQSVYTLGISAARPDWWASDDPSVGAIGQSGNDNLTALVGDALLETGEPRRYHDLAAIDDRLRVRAREALVAYLCAMDRVTMPDGSSAHSAKDLSDLLLLDVDAGLDEHASRIDDAITAIQAFVERALLRLEAPVLGAEFRAVWENRFKTFHTWQVCKRRELYPENTITCDEIERARSHEAFRLLEDELRQNALSIPVPAGLQYWPDRQPPAHGGIEVLQAQQPSTLHLPIGPGTQSSEAAVPTQNFGLLGRPDRAGKASWLSPVQTTPPPTPPSNGNGNNGKSNGGNGNGPVVRLTKDSTKDTKASRAGTAKRALPPTLERDVVVADQNTPSPGRDGTLPFWIEAAINLGARFLRIAAAGEPSGAAVLKPTVDDGVCCRQCGRVHPHCVDEYYFWLAPSSYYDLPPNPQDADLPNTSAGVSPWEDPATFPQLLDWQPGPMVHLYWCRVHDGEFDAPQRSSEGVALDPSQLATPGAPTLQLRGRAGDSLVFAIDAGIVATSDGGGPDGRPAYPAAPPYPDWSPEIGWRYDIADDNAIPLPLLSTPTAPVLMPPSDPAFGGLPAYPFFLYCTPGEPLVPLSAFAPSVAVAETLRCHCRYDDALLWYERYYDPLTVDNTWTGASVLPAVARQRAVLLDELETMLCWGDAVMAAHTDGRAPGGNSPEAFARARVIYDAAARILGPTPTTVLLDANASAAQTVSTFTPLAPRLNPRLVTLYERVSDRLGLIHQCENRTRRRYGELGKSLSFWGDDPAQPRHDDDCGCAACQSCDCDCCEASVACQPQSPYRFTHLIASAIEYAGVARGFAQALLAAFEKGDAEYLGALRATHEHQLQELTLKIRKDQWRDADWQIQALKQARLSAQNQLAYYTMLIASFRNTNESLYESLMAVAIELQLVAQALEFAAQLGGIVPDTYVGTMDFAKIPMTGSSMTNFFNSFAKATGFLGQDASMGAGVALTEAGWDRRLSDWQHQTDVFTFEIAKLSREILGAERRADAALREVGNQQRQIEHSRETDDFLRDKFTNQALYLYHQRSLAALYRQIYELALGSARQAERAFNLERGHTDEHYIRGELWDNLHEGLLAGERLELDLRRMHKTYEDCDRREYELTKHISLARDFPVEFLRLKVAGKCEIELPEWLFDQDYPGHYMRRIKNVTLTIPCVTGPYTGVHCRLTLLTSMTRVQPWLHGPVERCCDQPGHRCQCCNDSESRDAGTDAGQGYTALPGDPRIVRSNLATEAIATSGGVNDSGLFQLSFDQPRYLPFEFQGAVSRWRIELPLDNNYFDFDTLTDVIVQLNYTAREGGERLRRAATEASCCKLPGDSLRLLDLRHDFPDAWPALRAPEPELPNHHRRLALNFTPAMFPFIPARRVHSIDTLVLMFSAPNAQPGRHHTVRFWRHGEDRHDVEEFECVATGIWPGFFYGVVPLENPLGPLATEHAAQCWIEFPAAVGEICSAYLIAHYDAHCWPRCGPPQSPTCCADNGPSTSSERAAAEQP